MMGAGAMIAAFHIPFPRSPPPFCCCSYSGSYCMCSKPIFRINVHEHGAVSGLQIKGWVGPTISQPGKWPVQMHTPTPGAERQRAMAASFNSELALFLLVAEVRTAISAVSFCDRLPRICQLSSATRCHARRANLMLHGMLTCALNPMSRLMARLSGPHVVALQLVLGLRFVRVFSFARVGFETVSRVPLRATTHTTCAMIFAPCPCASLANQCRITSHPW